MGTQDELLALEAEFAAIQAQVDALQALDLSALQASLDAFATKLENVIVAELGSDKQVG